MSRNIEFIATEQLSYTRVDPMRYEYRPKGKWPWLQRLLFKALDCLKAHALIHEIELKHVSVPRTDFTEYLYRQMDELHNWDREPTQVFIGAKTFSEALKQPDVRQFVSFRHDLPHQHQMLGLSVHILPHMEGVIVV
jgi:hypothetical protein